MQAPLRNRAAGRCVPRGRVAVLLFAILFAALPTAALAHGPAHGRPTALSILFGWEIDPLFIIPAGAAIWGYLSMVRHVNRAHPTSRFPRLRVSYFLLGMAFLA